jgi:hypothetical protein
VPRSIAFLHVLVLVLVPVTPAAGQDAPADPRAAIDVVGGYAGFLDESMIGHTVVGATVRYQLTRRISLGPELVYMVGPGADRDLFLTGNLVVDFLPRPAGARAGRMNPYAVVGGGLMRFSNRFGNQPFANVEGAWTAGGGARLWMSDRAYAMAEYRVGWEPHVRILGGVGVLW